ncbi:MAG: phage baseplate assembly protein V [bacterium]
MSDNNKFFGKYRGLVLNNIDPLRQGRLLVQVPDVEGLIPSTWAMPCLPFAGMQSGMYVVPNIGSGVWVEYEQGDPDYPIWSGCWWGSQTEIPALALASPPAIQNMVMQTVGQNTLQMSDVPGPTGGFLLKIKSGGFISINDTGITISNGKGATIMLTGNTVTINNGALVIT